MAREKLEKLLLQEQQLKARIQKAKAQVGSQERKARTGKLLAWGVVVEQMLKDPEESLTAEQWANTCKRFLKDKRTLERALIAELEAFKPEEQAKPESELVQI